MTSFEDLPVPILKRIMDFLPNDTRYRAAEACSKIDALMDGVIPIKFEASEYMKVHRCVGRKKDKYLWCQEKGNDYTSVLYVGAVTEFILDSRIAIYDYSLLAPRFQNLTTLLVGWRNLEMLGKLGTWLIFPNLTHLRLGGPENERMSQIIKHSGREVLNNLSGFISMLGRVNFPKLDSFTMSIIFEESLENCMFDSFLTFLTRHQKTLRTLSIKMARTPYRDHQDRIENWRSVPNWEKRLRDLTLKLEYFLLYFYPYFESQNFLQLVDHISSTQTELEYHRMIYPRFQTFYTDLLDDNFRTLQYVSLSIWIFYTLDAKVFEQCTVLEQLHLHARPKKLVEFETENYGGGPSSSELVNIECLPKSLKWTRIVNFFIETKDCIKFTTEFPKLKRLALIGIGEKEELGFTLEMFALLVQRDVLVEVYRGFNTKSKKESEESDDGARIFMNLFGLPGKGKSDLDCFDKELGKVDLHPYPFGANKLYPQPFDDGESKLNVYVGQNEW